MYLLAFESSCDDTSVALLRDDELICMKTHTQLEHIATEGVVPETAARLHANHVFELLEEVLKIGTITLKDIDIFAATSEPGLIPSLLIGKTVAKTLATSHKKPLIWVNHIEGHIFSVLLERKLQDLKFPAIVLSASGGHNDLFLWKSLYEIEKLGGTLDDSAGESMDKVGRSMGLPFPAGREVDELAQKYTPKIHTNIPKFPLVLPADSLDFSFSGLKSAAIREIELRKILKIRTQVGQDMPDISQNKNIGITPPGQGGQDKKNEVGGFYIPYRHDLTKKAQENRSNPAPFEYDTYYKILKVGNLGDYKFLRQKPLLDYIVDFYCSELGLIIEIDGDSHGEQEKYDKKRTADLVSHGLTILRFTNWDILHNKEGVFETITQWIKEKISYSTPPTPPYQGGGNSSEESGILTENDRIEIAYGYQSIVTEILTQRVIQASKIHQTHTICLVGGVSANSALRAKVEQFGKDSNIPVFLPKSLKYCGDNAAMIGIRAYWEYRK
ncbi:MAG: tRNA (adenosine(37)-N6)-threonylcarbamoyltransferase complex transferase subunit TsaD [Candidatus Gracilibacteria bacterium]